jgi:hypothetical protein
MPRGRRELVAHREQPLSRGLVSPSGERRLQTGGGGSKLRAALACGVAHMEDDVGDGRIVELRRLGAVGLAGSWSSQLLIAPAFSNGR